jgi:hypothetical protein
MKCFPTAVLRKSVAGCYCTCAGIVTPKRQRLSDATCTGLQLANLWQDVSVDLKKGPRLHPPIGDDVAWVLGGGVVRRCGRLALPSGHEGRSRSCAHSLPAGLPLARTVDRRLSVDLELFSRGGMLVLDKIERRGISRLAQPSGRR